METLNGVWWRAVILLADNDHIMCLSNQKPKALVM
jgi:hypothetical protein